MRRQIALCLILAASLTTSTARADDDGAMNQEGPPPQAVLGRGIFEFAATLYNKLGKNPGNIVVAPYQLHQVITLATRGANGPTYDEIAKALNWPADGNVLIEAQKLVATDVRPGSGTGGTWNSGNRLWLSKGVNLAPLQWQDEAPAFQIQAEKVPASNVKGMGDALTAWSKEQTDDHLAKVLIPDAPLTDTKALMATSTRFAALWDKPARGKGKEKDGKASYVQERARMRFAETPDFKAAELELATGHTSLLMLIPKDASMTLTKAPDGAALRNLIDNLENTDITVEVPVFHINTHMDVTAGLRALGIESAFDKKADFGGWGSGVQLADVQQSLDISVGTDGVDVSTNTYARLGKPHAKPAKFNKVARKISKPFLFILRDTYWNVPLLFGRVEGQ